LRQQIARRLAIAAARAGAVKGELLDSDNELVRDRASTFVLGLAGMAPASTPSVSLNIEVKNFALSDFIGRGSWIRTNDLQYPKLRIAIFRGLDAIS
jgi:hypothetical protein